MKVILITGVSTGIGASFVKLVCERHPDWRIIGISRSKPSYQHPAFVHYEVDLTNHKKTKSLIDRIVKSNKIDVLINNAGSGWRGTVEQTTIEEAQHQLDINVWSVVNINNALLPSLRSQKNGFIVLVSSVATEINLGTIGYYSATKAFIEKLHGVLEQELKPWNIKCSIFSPGAVKTNFGHSMTNIEAYGKNPYKKTYLEWSEKFETMFSKPRTSEYAAAKLVRMIESSKSTKTYVDKRDQLYMTAKRILGEQIFNKLLLARFMKL